MKEELKVYNNSEELQRRKFAVYLSALRTALRKHEEELRIVGKLTIYNRHKEKITDIVLKRLKRG